MFLDLLGHLKPFPLILTVYLYLHSHFLDHFLYIFCIVYYHQHKICSTHTLRHPPNCTKIAYLSHFYILCDGIHHIMSFRCLNKLFNSYLTVIIRSNFPVFSSNSLYWSKISLSSSFVSFTCLLSLFLDTSSLFPPFLAFPLFSPLLVSSM